MSRSAAPNADNVVALSIARPGAEPGPGKSEESAAPNLTTTDDARNSELAALVARTVEGEARAFEAFYEGTIQYASAVVRRIVGTNFLEDVLAESYLQAWRDASRFDATRGNAIAWIVTIARTRALDRARLEATRHGGLSGAPEAEQADIEDESTLGPDALHEQTQQNSALHHAIARLSVNERWCIGLAYYRELPHSEVAAITGLPLGTVKSLINRAQKKLRDFLAGDDRSAETTV